MISVPDERPWFNRLRVWSGKAFRASLGGRLSALGGCESAPTHWPGHGPGQQDFAPEPALSRRAQRPHSLVALHLLRIAGVGAMPPE